MGIANHVYRRGATYVWRRRMPGEKDGGAVMQVSLRTRDPETARHLAAIVTANMTRMIWRFWIVPATKKMLICTTRQF